MTEKKGKQEKIENQEPERKGRSQSGSTSDRLSRQQVKAIKNALFFSGLFALALIIYGFCYINDSAYLGDRNIFTFWTEASRSLSFENGIHWYNLQTVTYTVEAAGKAPLSIDATGPFYFTILGLFVLSILNSIITSIARGISRYKIKKQLEPLYNMAQVAMRLSEESNINKSTSGAYSETKMHDLESAIESISPETPNAGLHTGDSDLQGIEEAINSLLERTRASYSQQIRFVSDASHELRTPIAVMKGYTDMLDRWGKDDEKILNESIAALKAETKHMNTLVEQLLFLARGDSGRTKLKMAEFSISDMMREVYDESLMIDTGHQWEIQADAEVTAYGDIAMLKQAVRILVDNAAKYTPAGEKITLRAKYDEAGAPTIVVQDNGIGISQKDLEHVFERFFRSDPARNSKQGGSGLGLSIAKWIVDQHNGYLDLASREDLGTRISIKLPRVKATRQVVAI